MSGGVIGVENKPKNKQEQGHGAMGVKHRGPTETGFTELKFK